MNSLPSYLSKIELTIVFSLSPKVSFHSAYIFFILNVSHWDCDHLKGAFTMNDVADMVWIAPIYTIVCNKNESVSKLACYIYSKKFIFHLCTMMRKYKIFVFILNIRCLLAKSFWPAIKLTVLDGNMLTGDGLSFIKEKL